MKNARRLLAGLTAGVLVSGAMPLAISAAAVASSIPAVVLTGSVGELPAQQALVIVEAEVPVGPGGPHGAPAGYNDVPVATATVTGPAFRVAVPGSRLLTRIERGDHGYVEFVVIVDSGRMSTTTAMAVPMVTSAADGNVAVAAVAHARLAQFQGFPAFQHVPIAMSAIRAEILGSPAIGACRWFKYRGQSSSETTIGEVHVAEVRNGPTDDYRFTHTDSTSVSFGYSTDPSKEWSFGGNITLTNSLSASGHQTFSDVNTYVDTLTYYQRYLDNAAETCPFPGLLEYKNRAVGTADNVDYGRGNPGADPYGGCTHAPGQFGHFPLNPGGGWSQDRAKAATETVNGAAWGFQFSASAGFTNDILQDYEASPTQKRTYICGNRALPDTPKIWDTVH